MNGIPVLALAAALWGAEDVEILPRGGPVGTDVTVRMAALPPEMEMVIGFGAVHTGYEWIARGETDPSGSLDATVRVPEWAEANGVHYFFITLPDRAPFGTSPGFHVTDPDGTLRVTGEVTDEGQGAGFTALRGEFEELYCVRGAAGQAAPGARLTVEGVLGDAGWCPGGIPVEVGEGGGQNRPAVLDLWERDQVAFGVYIPEQTEAGGEEFALNPLYDFLFLDLERGYEAEPVRAVAAGVGKAATEAPPALLVRIPPISEDGEGATRARVGEALALGADGLVVPHIRSLEEARLVVSFFEEIGASVWSPSNPEGDVILMLMLEDPETVAQAREFAEIRGYSVLACGIGSLAGALGGDREAAEEGAQHVLAEARRAGLPDMITANPETITGRVEQGFLALLLSGPRADEAIRIGREAAGRD